MNVSRVPRPRSHEAYRRAQRLIPGGVNSPARAFGAVGGEPPFIARGEGPYLYDIDDHKYVDLIGSWGAMILGHAHPEVVEAVTEAMKAGSSFGAPTERESEIAELITEAVPSVEMVRMVSSGTEAAMSAVRLVRGVTGRNVIVKFEGCYHGHVDSLLVAAGSSALTHGTPSSPGVPPGCTQDTLVLRYNDVHGLEAAFASRGREIAGVILEPVVGNMGLVPPTADFLTALRSLTTRFGALLVFDEVMTGFRLAFGGAQELFGASPDLTIFGKIIGGGLPVGAYGGRADLMKHIMPAGKVFQAGTLSGNPLATAAGVATLRILRDRPPYDHLEHLGLRLEDGLRDLATAARIPHQVSRVGSMWTLFFTEKPVTDFDSARRSDTARFARFFWSMMDHGIYLPCSQFEAAFLSAGMDESHIDRILHAAGQSFLSL
ncbi:MAG: glutamate-1-semialdehyde 2,1-aminomutase [Gemmataceae bacterium]|nr:glutamate-1-semialdehyde 2,1-aminomutase [Gemmataceae bacterium]